MPRVQQPSPKGWPGEIGPGIEVYANEAVRLAREHRHDGYLFEALVSREVLRQICLQPHREEALASAREAVEIAERMDSAPAEGAARTRPWWPRGGALGRRRSAS